MRLGLLCEPNTRERRVALTPAGVKELTGRGVEVTVETRAGAASGHADDAYAAAGAVVAALETVRGADLLVSVGAAGEQTSETAPAGAGKYFVGVFDPLWMPERASRLAATGVTSFSLDLVPRITRAQSMDVLSSMSTIAGYEAALLAASRLPRMFPLMMTAAGTLKPARVLVLGAGVAGLQALATARRLGAVVEGYDVRPAAAEQIRSMGARALELDVSDEGADAEGSGGYARAQGADAAQRQRDLLAPHVAEADALITTAAIPGKASPLLVTAEMLEAMRPGSVVVDLAAERGGNCALTERDREVRHGDVTILGPTDLPSRCATHASQMFSRNLVSFLSHLAPGGEMADVSAGDDEILSAMLVTHGGEVVHQAVRDALGSPDADRAVL